MKTYLTIDLKVRKANMLQSLAVITPAPVFAAIMAMHALDKKLGGILSVQGVGIIHKNATPWIEQIPMIKSKGKQEGLMQEIVQRRGSWQFGNKDFKRKPTENSMQPMALTDLEWTLLLACDQSPRDSSQVENKLLGMRFAGGDIEDVHVQLYEKMDDALHSIGSGYWVDDVTDRLVQEDATIHPIEKLLLTTKEDSWVVPVNLGYVLFEKPKAREGARDGYQHVFAEHLMGLVQYTYINIKRNQITRENLWRYGWDHDHFLVTNRSGVTLSPSFNQQ